MLKKMGWAGGGLGKDGEGLADLDQLWNAKKQGLKGLGSEAEKRLKEKEKRKARKKRKRESQDTNDGETALTIAYRQIEELQIALAQRDKWIRDLQRRLEVRQ